MEDLDRAIAASLVRIRAYVRAKVRRGMTKKDVASLAGVHPNTITKIEREDWEPDLKTIRKLEAIIPARWKPEDEQAPSGGRSEESVREAV